VTASNLARRRTSPEAFFARTVFCYGHRKVVRAVAGGLVRSGSVDGYVWEALAEVEPDLATRPRVVSHSEWLGFPPFVARADRTKEPAVVAFRDALLEMDQTVAGREALDSPGPPAARRHRPRVRRPLRRVGCQTDAHQSQFRRANQISARAEAPPLGESGGASLLVDRAAERLRSELK
jgi:ABC-type phosphate/phosphonate transport system substrate-binding protein